MPRGASHWQVEGQVHCVKSVYAANKPLWVYVISGDNALWIDTGINCTPTEVLIPYLTERAPRVWDRAQVVVVTHADVDHFGGLRRLKARRADTLVLAHEADKAWIESPEAIMRERYRMHAADGIDVPPDRQALLVERGGGGGKVDISLRGGEKIDLGQGGSWEVLHTPGHSAGHLALWNAVLGWAIIGDAALDWGVQDDTGQLIAPPPYYDIPAYHGAIETLRSLHAERVFTSHYGIMDRKRADRFYQNSLTAVYALEAAVHSALQERSDGWSLADLCIRAGQLVKHWPETLWPALADPVSAHLKQGLAELTVTKSASVDQIRYSAG